MTRAENRSADREQVRRRVREFVVARTGVAGLADDADLFAGGMVTSLFAMELITFLEREFELTIVVEDLVPGNFRSIDACAEYAARRRREGPPGW